MQAQDCIDIVQIKTDLSNLSDNCNCSTTLVLGESGKTVKISDYQLGLQVQNECIEVYGTVVIDQAIYFKDCDFIFDDGALIQLEDDIDYSNALVPVIFQRCNLQSCDDKFWDGIDIGARNAFYFWDNTMQHALNGIHSYSGPSIAFISNSVFNDNRTAIDIGKTASISSTPNTRSYISLNGNIFAQTNELKLHWSDHHWEYEESYGVVTSNTIVNSLVGNDPCNRTNIFISLLQAYELRNSISHIHADLFHGPAVFQYGDPLGSGIYATPRTSQGIGASSLVQRGWPTNDIETFNNLDQPILTLGTTTDLEEIIIRNSNRGIETQNSFMLDKIKDNDIQVDVGPGILVYASGVASEIEENTIEVNHDWEFGQWDATGIIVYGVTIGASLMGPGSSLSTGTQIRDNSIDLNPGYHGISTWGNGVQEYRIKCNEIFISETLIDEASGIEIKGGRKNLIKGNMISGLYSSSSASEINGIKIIESRQNLLKKNHTRNTITGFHFSNWNNHTMQQNNSFKDHDYGYYIGESGVTGDQKHPNNRWDGTFSSWAALNDGVAEMSRYEGYQGLVTTACWPQTISPDPGWFDPLAGSAICSPPMVTDCETDEIPPELESLRFLDTLIARGELEFSDFEMGRKWQAERYLLQTLTRYPDLVRPSGSLMDSFLTNAQTTVLWDYHELRRELEEISIIPESISDDWFDMFDQYQNLVNSAETAIDDWLNHPDSLELTQPILAIYEDIDSIWTESHLAFQTWRGNYVDELEDLLTDIMALSTPNSYAASEKVVLEAKVRLALSIDSISSSLKNSLTLLAESCLLENGPAVIDATVILRHLDAQPAMFDLNCTESGGHRRAGPARISSSTFEVFPNPTSGIFTLKLNSIPEHNGSLEIYNRNGQLMHSAKLEAGLKTQEFSADHLPAGHYTIRISFQGEMDNRSLIISR